MENFISTTTIHGIYQIRHAGSSLGRLLFLAATTVATYFAISQVIELFIDFSRHPMSSSIMIGTMTSELVSRQELTVCVSDWVSRTRAKENNFSDSEVAAILSVLQPIPKFNVSVKPSQNMLELLSKNDLKHLWNLVNKIIKPYPRVTDQHYSILSVTGDLCFQVYPSSKQPLYSAVGSMMSTFIMPRFSNDTHGILKDMNHEDGYMKWYLYRLPPGAVALADYDKLDNPTTTNSVLQTVHLKSFKTKKDCTEANDNDFLPSGYIERMCIQNCVVSNIFVRKFNCTVPALSNLNRNVCNLPELIPSYIDKAFFQHYAKWQSESIEDINRCVVDKEKCRGKTVCSTWETKSKTTKESFKPSIVDITDVTFIYIDDIEVIETYPRYSWEIMLSNVGGQTGLWLGASMLSIIHVIYSFTEMVIIGLHRRFTHQETVTKTKPDTLTVK